MKEFKTEAKINDRKLTREGKELRANQFLNWGQKFYGAAILLRQNNYDGVVTKHLVCQSLEILLKGILLKIDFDKYNNNKNLKKIGHDLEECLKYYKEHQNIIGVIVDNNIEQQIKEINFYYKKHFLRYASIFSLFIPLENINIDYIDKFIKNLILKIENIT
jgi:hypothetical protein